MRGVESFSKFESSLSKGQRDREFESVQFFELENEKILPDQRSLHEYLEKEAERAYQGEFAAQKRLSEAQAEMDRRKVERRNADIRMSKLHVCIGMQIPRLSV